MNTMAIREETKRAMSDVRSWAPTSHLLRFAPHHSLVLNHPSLITIYRSLFTDHFGL